MRRKHVLRYIRDAVLLIPYENLQRMDASASLQYVNKNLIVTSGNWKSNCVLYKNFIITYSQCLIIKFGRMIIIRQL